MSQLVTPKLPRDRLKLLKAYKIQAQLEPDTDAIARQTLAAGRFILATNVLDIDQLSCDQMIAKYKEQQSSERGFAFLKDP